MRSALCSLLILFTAAGAIGSPASFSASILTSGAACTQGINRAQVITDAGNTAVVRWTVDNGTIAEGQSTQAIKFTAVDSSYVALSATVIWSGMTLTTHAVLPIFGAPEIVEQPRGATGGCGTTISQAAVVSIAGKRRSAR